MNNDLISREALKKAIIETFGIYFDGTYDNRKILKLIDNAPTVAVNCKDCDGYEAGYSAGLKDAERPQGEWIEMTDNYGHSSYFCSRCGTQEGKLSDVCPNCGADMRGDNNG